MHRISVTTRPTEKVHTIATVCLRVCVCVCVCVSGPGSPGQEDPTDRQPGCSGRVGQARPGQGDRGLSAGGNGVEKEEKKTAFVQVTAYLAMPSWSLRTLITIDTQMCTLVQDMPRIEEVMGPAPTD